MDFSAIKSRSADIIKAIKKSEEGASENTIKQYETMNSVRRLDENIFMLDYKADYHLGELLSQGVSSIGDLIKFMAKISPFGAGAFKKGEEKGGGCSTFNAFTPAGEPILGRNFDFKNAPCFVLWTHPENYYASLSVVDNNFLAFGTYVHKAKTSSTVQALLAPYCCVDGINEKGLAIAVLQIRAKATNQTEPGKPNISTTSMIRAVLDTCANVDEAIAFLESHNMHDSLACCYHYQIIDSTGRSVVAEYIDSVLHIYEKGNEKYPLTNSIYENDNMPWQYVTNFSVTKDIGSFEVEQHGEDRAKAITDVLCEKKGVMTEMEAMDLLSYVRLDYKHPKYPWYILALWSSVYNSKKCTLTLAANVDYKRIYTFEVNKPYTVIERSSIAKSEYPKGNWQYL